MRAARWAAIAGCNSHANTAPPPLQGEPFVPILFVVPIIFMLTVLLREGLGLRIISPTAR